MHKSIYSTHRNFVRILAVLTVVVLCFACYMNFFHYKPWAIWLGIGYVAVLALFGVVLGLNAAVRIHALRIEMLTIASDQQKEIESLRIMTISNSIPRNRR